jgi:hypothetical protein
VFPNVHGYKNPKDFSDQNPLNFSTQHTSSGSRREFMDINIPSEIFYTACAFMHYWACL